MVPIKLFIFLFLSSPTDNVKVSVSNTFSHEKYIWTHELLKKINFLNIRGMCSRARLSINDCIIDNNNINNIIILLPLSLNDNKIVLFMIRRRLW